MNLMPDLFSFAYVPGWYDQLDELAELAIPEPWRFRNPNYYTKNPDTPILERYIHSIFKKQIIDYNEERNPAKAAEYFHVENEYACFHTGLYTKRYKAIYGCFDRNKRQASMLDWYFRGFSDEISPWLKYISPLPKKPHYDKTGNMASITTRNGRSASTWIISSATRRTFPVSRQKSAKRKTCPCSGNGKLIWRGESCGGTERLWFRRGIRAGCNTCCRSA